MNYGQVFMYNFSKLTVASSLLYGCLFSQISSMLIEKWTFTSLRCYTSGGDRGVRGVRGVRGRGLTKLCSLRRAGTRGWCRSLGGPSPSGCSRRPSVRRLPSRPAGRACTACTPRFPCPSSLRASCPLPHPTPSPPLSQPTLVPPSLLLLPFLLLLPSL